MKILKAIIVAFSMYSKIPMPRFNWGSEDMKYHLIFFPWVGAVIGAVEFLWFKLANFCILPHIVFTVIAMVIPIVITGGFHIDGFMDTSDALASYGDKEKRLEILKDSHVGAFAIIRFITLGLIMFAAIFTMNDVAFMAWCGSFFTVRAVSGICVVRYKKAKAEGILNTSAETANDKIVMIALAIQFIALAVFVGGHFAWFWNVQLFALVLTLIYYIYIAYSKFGGITGDLAGWFLCQAEVFMAVAAAILSCFK